MGKMSNTENRSISQLHMNQASINDQAAIHTIEEYSDYFKKVMRQRPAMAEPSDVSLQAIDKEQEVGPNSGRNAGLNAGPNTEPNSGRSKQSLTAEENEAATRIAFKSLGTGKELASILLLRPVQVGRKLESNDLVISDEPTISRVHCKLYETQRAVWVEDLGATNGTFVNGRRIRGTHKLESGDRLKLGKLEMRVSFTEEMVYHRMDLGKVLLKDESLC